MLANPTNSDVTSRERFRSILRKNPRIPQVTSMQAVGGGPERAGTGLE